MKILIVEDNPVDLKLLALVLKAAGHAILQARSGGEAMGILDRKRPNLVFLDLALPDMDGLALARRLKRTAGLEDIRIAAVTAFPDQWSEHAAREAGCDVYFAKPINIHTLPGELDESMKRPAPHAGKPK